MKSVICSVAFVACFSLSTSVFAQGRGHLGGPPAGHGGGISHDSRTRTETKLMQKAPMLDKGLVSIRGWLRSFSHCCRRERILIRRPTALSTKARFVARLSPRNILA